jgi:hypothetical protein
MSADIKPLSTSRLYAKVVLDFPDNPKVIEAGPMAELAYLRCTLYSKAARSNGHIHRSRAPRWLMGIPEWEAAMEALERVGLVDKCDDGWQIPLNVWRAWNKTSDEIDADSEMKRQSAIKGNHMKHHVKTGKPSVGCPLCAEEASQTARTMLAPCEQDARKAVANASQAPRKVSPETETETETESKKSSSSVTEHAHPQRKATLFAAASLVLERQSPSGVHNPTGLALSISERLHAKHQNVDQLIETLGTEAAALYIADSDTPAHGAPAAVSPERRLASAREYGASVKLQHLTGEYADMADANRQAFLSELNYRNEQEDWHNEAVRAYDAFTTAPTLRIVPLHA